MKLELKLESNNEIDMENAMSKQQSPGGTESTENYLSLIFRKINDFVHRFILDHKYIYFTILVVNFTILYC
jgi:hypothetical protein